MDSNFLRPSRRMRDYCTQTKETGSFGWVDKDKHEKQGKNFSHFPRGTHVLEQEIQAVTEAFLGKLTQCHYSTSLLQDSSCEVPHLIRLQFMPYSQAAVLMLQQKQHSDLIAALPKLPVYTTEKKVICIFALN